MNAGLVSAALGLAATLLCASGSANEESDRRVVAMLDTQFQAAVKRNDADQMARILQDDMVLVLGDGRVSSRKDELQEARDKTISYERQDEDPGTQAVRVYGDTAIVTARLWVKGVRKGIAFDRHIWFSDTYVRTASGWRYFFGQASLALPNPQDRQQPSAGTARDGQHDFDFEFGTWKTHLKRLLNPLTGSTAWVEYDGTTTVRPVWNGRANLVELEVDGPRGHLEALSLRLYNPLAHQWSLNFANSIVGTISTPSVGEFRIGRGEFIDQETLGPRTILVRFLISQASPTVVNFEQSYSGDGGKTWEINWSATDTRTADKAAP
jgi:ketosteroid isomerase-like protein